MRYRNLRHCLFALACLALAGSAAAQSDSARVEVRLREDAGSALKEGDAVAVELRSTTDPALSWSGSVHSGAPVLFRFVPPGRYRLVAGTFERELVAEAGRELRFDIVAGAGGARALAPPDVSTAPSEHTAYGTRFDSSAVHMLPQSGGVWGLIERGDPLAVTELIEGGGAYPEMQRLGASGASWTQTSYRLGGADITDPDRTGFPLLYPNLDALEAVSVATAGQPAEGFGAGTVVTLVPRRPATKWERSTEVVGSPHGFQSVNELPATSSSGRLQSIGIGSFVLSGPVSPRVGLLVAGAVASSSRAERERTALLPSRTEDLTAHLVFSATARDEFRVFGQTDRLALPVTGRARLVDPGLQQQERIGLLSGTWDHRPASGLAWSANLTYGRSSTTQALAGVPVLGTFERLLDGPAEQQAGDAGGARHRTYVSWRGDAGGVRAFGVRHRPQFGVNTSLTGASRIPTGDTLLGELVGGLPARAWKYTTGGTSPEWGATELAVWATDRIALASRVDLDLGLRASATSASRDGSSAHIPWHAVSPRIQGTWRALPGDRLTFLAGYARYGARLPLNYLAYGDANSLSGEMRAWTDRNGDRVLQPGEVGGLIAPVGPCCAGGQLNTIDSRLHPPHTNEFLLGIHVRLGDRLMLRVSSTDRRQYDLIQPVNSAGIPANYRLTHIPDPGLDMGRTEDDQLLPVFDRLPASFGTDRYTLENITADSAIDHGVDIVLERAFDGRWGTLIGATAHKSEGLGGNRGYRPDENDQGVLGEVFSDPNAGTFARGRLFFERGYVVKWSGLWRLPRGFRGGVAARYQDGQHFARVVLATGLPQGTDAIPALPRGKTRFTYVFTLDARVEKHIAAGGGRTTLLLEAYNLLNTNNEVAENVLTGSAFRDPTVVQPPRSLRVGLRYAF